LRLLVARERAIKGSQQMRLGEAKKEQEIQEKEEKKKRKE